LADFDTIWNLGVIEVTKGPALLGKGVTITQEAFDKDKDKDRKLPISTFTPAWGQPSYI
jgi:hypothetical protein